MKSTNITRLALLTGFALLLPLLAMQITDEVVWDLTDFAAAGVLLLGAGLTYEVASKNGGSRAYAAAAGVAVATALILVWLNLAIGIIGSEDNLANLMHIGVLAVGTVGAIIARFEPLGMARALFATALAQMLVGMVAQIAGSGRAALILEGFFVVLWIGAALLFLRASRLQSV